MLQQHSLAGQRPRAGQRDRARHDPLRQAADRAGAPAAPLHRPARAVPPRVPSRRPLPASLRELEMQAIHDALDRHDGNKPKAAEELGISLKTLYNKLNQAAALEKSA